MKAARRGQQSSDVAVNNLPQYLTSFVGRAAELDALKSVLGRSRLVTLTGPGGAGKSRLAAELGRACLDLWPGGVWWVELAPISDPLQLAGTVLAALELPGRGDARDAVIAWLTRRQALLVIDNCEHLVAACAEFCQHVLRGCPQLTVIATSREPLRVAGEARWPVASLTAGHAVELFEARAQLALPNFKVVASNREPVTEICEHLDGLPLAIELAAARVGMMTEQEILSQLKDRFHLLTGGSRTAPERQQAMSATIDWSYQLLTEDEAALFRRLSVFRGGFTLDSAQAICADGTHGNLLDLLAGLVQKSMVVAERTEGSRSRYRLLESQLAYAEDRLREADELDLIRRRHYEYFSDSFSIKWHGHSLLADVASPPGFADAQWIVSESGNLWAAAGWARNKADDLGLGLAADMADARFGDLAPLRSLLEEALRRSPAKGRARIHALTSAYWIAYYLGDYEAVLSFTNSGLALARELGDAEERARALHAAAAAHEGRGELDRAAAMFEEALSLLKGSIKHGLITMITNAFADLLVHRGDCAVARDILADCLVTAKAKGSLFRTATCLETLAWAQRGLNEPLAATASWKEALSINRGIKNQIGTIDCLEGLSMMAEVRGDDRRAVRLAAAANRIAGEISYRVDPWWFRHQEDSHRRSRTRLGTRESNEAWSYGWSLSSDSAIDYALRPGDSETSVEAGPLSRRQREVVSLVAAGLTNREIANRLFIAERTAEGHVERIRNLLGVRSRIEVATWAVENGLASGPTVPEATAAKKRGTPKESP